MKGPWPTSWPPGGQGDFIPAKLRDSRGAPRREPGVLERKTTALTRYPEREPSNAAVNDLSRAPTATSWRGRLADLAQCPGRAPEILRTLASEADFGVEAVEALTKGGGLDVLVVSLRAVPNEGALLDGCRILGRAAKGGSELQRSLRVAGGVGAFAQLIAVDPSAVARAAAPASRPSHELMGMGELLRRDRMAGGGWSLNHGATTRTVAVEHHALAAASGPRSRTVTRQPTWAWDGAGQPLAAAAMPEGLAGQSARLRRDATLLELRRGACAALADLAGGDLDCKR